MKVAHISDLHILNLSDLSLKDLFNKRVTGLINLLTFRKNQYSFDVLQRLVDDLLDEGIDHTLLTGDLSNLALDSEFFQVRETLKFLGGYKKLSLVPGNHDYYTLGSIKSMRFESYFFPFMFKDFTDFEVELYPYFKEIGEDIVVAGLNSAIRNYPFFAYGKISSDQIGKLIQTFNLPKYKEKFKIVMFHHNLHRRGNIDDFFSSLLNKDEVMKAIVEVEPDLVLYGHDHRPYYFSVEGKTKKIHFFCNGSSTRLNEDVEKVARYNIYHIEDKKFVKVETKIYDLVRRKFIWRF